MKPMIVLKNNSSVYFERRPVTGWYIVEVRTPAGELHDRMACDSYRMALEYRRAFLKVAKNL